MILKYTYSYSGTKGTFHVGLKEGVVTHSLSAHAMSQIAAQEGGLLSWLRRTLISEHLGQQHFELVNVTPEKIKERGVMSPDDAKELYDLARYDEEVNKAASLVAEAIRQDFLDSIKNSVEPMTVASMKKYVEKYVEKFFKPDFNVQVQVNKEDPSKIDVSFTVPIISIEFELGGMADGSQNRT
jgi:hypothetical protein